MTGNRSSLADQLAAWAFEFEPTEDDLALAQRSLRDTLAVTLAARGHRVADIAANLPEGARWSSVGHVLDFDDLHMASTTHISAVCVPTAVTCGGDGRAYLAAAGVMARLGTALGWQHYAAGWHTTCTAGAPAAAVGAAVALGLSRAQTAAAIALAIPASGGLQRAFGTDSKSLQVGFAVDAGLRAARLSAAGASADPSAADAWLELVGGQAEDIDFSGPAVPGGLAIKIYPACYALQRPINAVAELARRNGQLALEDVTRIVVRTSEATVVPLIHHRPRTGLQAKFSIEYAIAAALLDAHPGFDSFTDEAARRREARRLVGLVEVKLHPGGAGLLDGVFEVEVHTRKGDVLRNTLQYPPGSPDRPPTDGELLAKITDCLRAAGLPHLDPSTWNWSTAAQVLRTHAPMPAN